MKDVYITVLDNATGRYRIEKLSTQNPARYVIKHTSIAKAIAEADERNRRIAHTRAQALIAIARDREHGPSLNLQ